MNLTNPQKLVSLLVLAVPLVFSGRLAFAQTMPMPGPPVAGAKSGAEAKAPGQAPASAASGATTKYPDGRSVTVAPDGTTTTTFPGGRSVSTMPDGSTATSHPDGTRTVTQADGSSTTTWSDGHVSETAAPTARRDGDKKPKDKSTMGPGMKGGTGAGMGGGMENEMGGMGPGMGGAKKKAPKHPKADQPTTDSPPSDPGMGGDM
jgi:hypothetical protein